MAKKKKRGNILLVNTPLAGGQRGVLAALSLTAVLCLYSVFLLVMAVSFLTSACIDFHIDLISPPKYPKPSPGLGSCPFFIFWLGAKTKSLMQRRGCSGKPGGNMLASSCYLCEPEMLTACESISHAQHAVSIRAIFRTLIENHTKCEFCPRLL